MEPIITTIPGREKLLWGGTRRSVKLSRPVEAGKLFDPATKCPFHSEDEASLAEYEGADGVIRVLGNAFTPHRKHMLVIPKACTDEKFLRVLGGYAFTKRCLEIIGEQAALNGPEEWVFAVHVFRGQNVPHLHWHLYAYHPEEKVDLSREVAWTYPETSDKLLLRTTQTLQVVVRGTKVGQIMIVPTTSFKGRRQMPLLAEEIAATLHDVVTLTNKAFVSTQGERPHYSVSGRIGKKGEFRYLTYVPELQAMGCSDDLADLNGSARARTWSPEETAEHLRSFA